MAKNSSKNVKSALGLICSTLGLLETKNLFFFQFFFLIYSFECIFIIYPDYCQISPDPETPPPILTPTTPPNTNNAIYRKCSIPELNSTPFIVLKHNFIINI